MFWQKLSFHYPAVISWKWPASHREAPALASYLPTGRATRVGEMTHTSEGSRWKGVILSFKGLELDWWKKVDRSLWEFLSHKEDHWTGLDAQVAPNDMIIPDLSNIFSKASLSVSSLLPSINTTFMYELTGPSNCVCVPAHPQVPVPRKLSNYANAKLQQAWCRTPELMVTVKGISTKAFSPIRTCTQSASFG